MRSRFVDQMRGLGCGRDFAFIARQRGMFSMLGLSKEQVEALRREHAIYMVGSSRINVAGLTESNLPRFCEALAGVMG